MVRKFVIDREVKKDAMGWAGDGAGGTHKTTGEESQLENMRCEDHE